MGENNKTIASNQRFKKWKENYNNIVNAYEQDPEDHIPNTNPTNINNHPEVIRKMFEKEMKNKNRDMRIIKKLVGAHPGAFRNIKYLENLTKTSTDNDLVNYLKCKHRNLVRNNFMNETKKKPEGRARSQWEARNMKKLNNYMKRYPNIINKKFLGNVLYTVGERNSRIMNFLKQRGI